MSLAGEFRELSETAADLSRAMARVRRQEALIDHLQQRGIDTGRAESLLDTLVQSRDLMQAHRRTILRELGFTAGRDLVGNLTS
jgi:hypothetical protein